MLVEFIRMRLTDGGSPGTVENRNCSNEPQAVSYHLVSFVVFLSLKTVCVRRLFV